MLPWMAAKRLIGLFRRRKATDLSEKARKDSVHESAVS
jgi:hypothetical protein